MGGSSGGGEKSTGTLPWWIKDAHKTLTGNAEDFAYGDRGAYTPYPDQRIAGLESQQIAANTAREDMFNRGDVAGQFAADQYGMASDLTGKIEGVAMSEFDNAERLKRMNPYLEGVLNPQLREANQSFDRRLNQGQADSVARGGSIGAYRVNLEDALLQGERAQTLGDITGKGNFDAYNQALSSFESDRDTRLRGLDSSISNYQNIGAGANTLGTDSQKREIDMINELYRSGAVNQDLKQQEMNQGVSDFNEERDWPMRNMNFLAGILSGVPSGQLSGTTTTAPQPGIAAQILGLGLGAYGLNQTFGG